jgi:quinolinate synthase
MINVEDIEKYGFLNVEVDRNIDFKTEIRKLCNEKNAVILGHYYQTGDIQDIADFIGDSLALAQQAAKTTADVIMFSGVHFMAETAKILCPDKKVLLPDMMAGCSLADSCPADKFEEFIKENRGRTVISYVNTTAEIKAMTDIICTSSNALQIVNSLPETEKIIFAPDRNLGNYIKSQSTRDIIVWDGACHVHEEFSLERILELKNQNPNSKIIAHPECQKPILLISDFIGSTAALLKFVQNNSGDSYIVATESGILHQMKKSCPDKVFIAAPPKDSTCGCNDCNYMKLNTLKKIYIALKYELPELTMDETLRKKAEVPIRRMLEISEKLGL